MPTGTVCIWGNVMQSQQSRTRMRGAFGLFVLASAVYLWGLCPTVYWYDSPEFITLVQTLDIGHPSGSPTYVLCAKLATFIPIGSLALRINAVSAIVAASIIALLFVVLYDLLTHVPDRLRCGAALSGALFLLVAESLWRFAEVAEVYTLQNGFMLVLLYILLQARMAPESWQVRYHWLFALLYGLSAGVHATMACFVPAFLGFLALTGRRAWHPQRVAFLAFFFLLGFSTYLYLPLRTLTEPAFNWGDPRTFSQFLHHISDRKDAAVHTVFHVQQLPQQVWMYATHLANEFSVLGVCFGLLGLLYTWRTDKALCFLLSGSFLGYVAFFIRSWWNTAWGFIPSYVIFALWIGLGVAWGMVFLQRVYAQHALRIPRTFVYGVVSVSIVGALVQTALRHAPIAQQTKNYATASYGAQLLAQLPPDALVFCEYSWFPLLYMQQVERRRPDLTFLVQGEVFTPQYFAYPSARRFPNIRLVTSETPTRMSTHAYFWNLVRLNAPEHPLFWEADGQYQRMLASHLLPQGFLFAFDPEHPVTITPDVLAAHWQSLSRTTSQVLQGMREDATTDVLTHKLNLLADYFRQRGLEDEAAKTYDLALTIRPHKDHVHNNYGSLLLSQGKMQEALTQFSDAYRLDPINPVFNKNVGKTMLRLGDDAQAVRFLERARDFGAVEGDVYAYLGEAYAKVGRFPAALQAVRTALARYTDPQAPESREERVQEKITWAQDYARQLERVMRSSVPAQGSEQEGK